MSYNNLTYEIENRINIISINRPEKLNALNIETFTEIDHAIKSSVANDEVRIIIITGVGDKAFVAGADIKEFVNFTMEQGSELSEAGHKILSETIEGCSKPIIAAINGPAVGVGVTMTLPMDIRLASEEAKFGFVFARRGLVPEAASSWFLPRIVGISKSLEWTFSGKVFNAEEALEGGLIRSIHSKDSLLDEAKSIAKEIIENTSPVSVSMTRQMLWKMLGADHPMEAHKIDSRAIYELGKGDDTKEGVNSFLEKRAPDFPSKVSQDMPDFYPWWQEKEFK